ncbi:MAG: glutamine-hydrolyzing carbamoyl-phosphate synthase small subunit [Candidatus Lokiarchaeota archaeon]|nr:glutamine-hydrolyzing carbamoyl-phosphate synthase small subunit [Candidatus Lokiarchaeota archaeon]
MKFNTEKCAILMFKDGTYFKGLGFGATNQVSGEITFTTIPGSGYVETLTDKTNKGQILLFTYPSIGNYGVPAREFDKFGLIRQFESDAIQIKGMIVNEYCEIPSHYESIRSLEDWLIEENVPGIQWIDTRMITQTLIEEGSKLGLLRVYEVGEKQDIEELKSEAQKIKDINQYDLVEEVSSRSTKKYTPKNSIGTVVILDLGVKNNIIRTLLQKGLEVIIVPYYYNYQKIMDLNPNGVLISNGPGNPLIYRKSIETIKDLIKNGTTTIGFGLGHILMGLAIGFNCYKLKAEHRGSRTTVESKTGHCYITFQNHAYCIKDLKYNDFKLYFHDKDDDTIEGIIHENKPIFSVAFNPEASPGSLDVKDLIFDKFIDLMEVN